MSVLDGCWVKFFSDGTKEWNYDIPIYSKNYSWSQGRLSNIKEVFLRELLISVTLEVSNTEYHQFDRFLCELASGSTPIRKARYIQALITKEHVGLYLCYNNDSIYASWVSIKKKPSSHYYRIKNQDVGKWITFRITTSTSELFLASNKDALNGQQLFK